MPAQGRPQGAPLRARWRLALTAVVFVAGAVLVYWLTRPLPPPRFTNAVRVARMGGGTWVGTPVTDGVRLYFTDWLCDRSVIVQVPVAGGEAVPFPTPFRYAIVSDISPNHSELLVTVGNSFSFTNEMPLWVLPVTGLPAPRGRHHDWGDLVT